MKIKSSEFIISAVKREQYPDDNLPEIAFVGRSNVGKSSIINSLTNRRGLAKVSQTPGNCRHKPTADDVQMYEWIKHYGYEVVVIATKSDKISNNQIGKSEKLIKETLGLPKDHKLKFFSSLNKKGKDELVDYLFDDLVEEV